MTDRDDHSELERLLPFYVNGTLAAAARARIDATLPGSSALRAALAEERALQRQLRSATEQAVAESEAGFEARQAALDNRLGAPARPAPSLASPGPLTAALAFLNPRRWNPAISLSLAALIPLQGGIIASQSGQLAALRDENFKLASGPCEDRPAAGAVQLEFADQADWNGIAALLDAESLSIARSGQFGTLTVKTGKQGAELAALLARLRRSPLVASAEPAA